MGGQWPCVSKCEKTDIAALEQTQHLGCTKATRKRRIPRDLEFRFKTHKKLDDTIRTTSNKPWSQEHWKPGSNPVELI